MQIAKKKVKDPNFCFTCGKPLVKEQYILNFGTPGATFELCKNCMKKLGTGVARVLQ